VKLRGAGVSGTRGQLREPGRSSAWEEERRKSVPSAGEGDTLGRRNPRKGAAAGSSNRRPGLARTPGELKALKARIGFGTTLAAYGGGARIRRVMADRIAGVNVRRARHHRQGGCGFLGGETLEGRNPMGASGAKQTRKAPEGANPRGGEKPRGGNVPGEVNPGQVDFRC
jgi:hypothetical protein